jgi:hypothetical protein
MKLIIQNDRIAATATDEYQTNGTEQAVLYAPADFDVARLSEYTYVGGSLSVGVPAYVTMRQARLALLGAGKLASVTAAINTLPSPQKEAAQIEWEYSQTVERNRGFVLLLGAALGLTDAQLDGLFVQAATL